MIVESEYRGYRIEVVAFEVQGVWDADVRIRRTRSTAAVCAGRLTCQKTNGEGAEERGAVCARQWVDRHGRAA